MTKTRTWARSSSNTTISHYTTTLGLGGGGGPSSKIMQLPDTSLLKELVQTGNGTKASCCYSECGAPIVAGEPQVVNITNNAVAV